MEQSDQEIYRSRRLAARAVGGAGGPDCVVTFGSYTDDRTLDRPGFAEAFLRKQGIDAIHVLARDNDWYLYREMPALCAAVAACTARYANVLTYGSSMGAYAAIRFGALVGARRAIAVSPQFTVDPAVVPFEHRWAEARHLDFGLEQRSGGFVDTAYVIYDPRNIDRHHVELYRPWTRVVDIAVPNSGHPSSGYLAQAGLLQPGLLDIIHDRIDVDALVRAARARRREIPDYFFALAVKARHPDRRVALAARAAALTGGNPDYAVHHAWWLALADRPDEAEAAFAGLLAQAPDHPTVLSRLAEFRERQGDLPSAVQALDRLIATQPSALIYRSRRDALVRRLEAARAQQARETALGQPGRWWRFGRSRRA